ncbi:MAG: Lacal_2735 family protein [Aequorivita sp.]
MFSWFKKKSKLERLKKQYADLMRKSYKTALKDINKSEKAHRQADELFQKIKNLSLENGEE